jgi:hypothetical protein
MQQTLTNSAVQPPGAGSGVAAQRGDAKNRQRSGKNFVQKSSREVAGVPGTDLDFWMEWLLTNLDKDSELGEVARDQCTGLFADYVVCLLRIGLCKHDATAKTWAGEVLADAYASLQKHHGELNKVNPAYQNTWKKLKPFRPDVLVPRSPVGQILQKEVRTAERYYRECQYLSEVLKRQRRPWKCRIVKFRMAGIF